MRLIILNRQAPAVPLPGPGATSPAGIAAEDGTIKEHTPAILANPLDAEPEVKAQTSSAKLRRKRLERPNLTFQD